MNTNTTKTKTTIYLDKSQLEQIDTHSKTHSYKSRNDFFLRAIENQMVTDTMQNTGDIFTQKIADALEKQNATLNRRISQGLFRYAVEMSMVMHMQAAQLGVTDEQIDRMRGRAIHDMKKLNGKISLEAIADFQAGRSICSYEKVVDDQWED